MRRFSMISTLLTLILGVQIFIVNAQTTQFTYQGSLQDGGAAANGSYDFQFALFSAVTGGTQLGTTVSTTNVTVTNGVFSVNLNFGDQFSGAAVFLEIRVKPTSGANFTTLTPRQTINSAPYSVRSASSGNALNLGGLAANQYVLTTDPRLTDSRNPTAGSTNYIQNGTGQQSSANFNIIGTGTASFFNANQNFRIANTRVLTATPQGTLSVGFNAGALGNSNSFVGNDAGLNITNGSSNSFFGKSAGFSNSTGSNNSFFGAGAGQSIVGADNNSFFGTSAGSVSSGGNNSFFGTNTGAFNSTGTYNSIFGTFAGGGIVSGVGNTIIGASANTGAGDLTNATALGFRATVNQSNSLILGAISGINLADSDTRVGIGTTAPTNPFSVVGPGTQFGGSGSFQEVVARFQQRTAANHLAVSLDAPSGQDAILYLARNGGAQWGIRNDVSDGNSFQIRYQAEGDNSIYFKITPTGQVSMDYGSGGVNQLCQAAGNVIAFCSSSIRYKDNINDFSQGLGLIKRLRPVTFRWKSTDQMDMGLVAEEVAETEPLLVTRNEKGEIEGVKYDRVGVVLVNAVNEQQAQIETQQKQIDEQKIIITKQQDTLDRQQKEIEALKLLVCAQSPTADICRVVKKEE